MKILYRINIAVVTFTDPVKQLRWDATSEEDPFNLWDCGVEPSKKVNFKI